jgi:hypothetical protein
MIELIPDVNCSIPLKINKLFFLNFTVRNLRIFLIQSVRPILNIPVDYILDLRYSGLMMNITANRFFSFYFWYFIQEPPVR